MHDRQLRPAASRHVAAVGRDERRYRPADTAINPDATQASIQPCSVSVRLVLAADGGMRETRRPACARRSCGISEIGTCVSRAAAAAVAVPRRSTCERARHAQSSSPALRAPASVTDAGGSSTCCSARAATFLPALAGLATCGLSAIVVATFSTSQLLQRRRGLVLVFENRADCGSRRHAVRHDDGQDHPEHADERDVAAQERIPVVDHDQHRPDTDRVLQGPVDDARGAGESKPLVQGSPPELMGESAV